MLGTTALLWKFGVKLASMTGAFGWLLNGHNSYSNNRRSKKTNGEKNQRKISMETSAFLHDLYIAHAAAGPVCAVNLRIAQQKRFDRNGDEC